MIAEGYTGMTRKVEGRSVVHAEIVGEEVTVHSSDRTVIFDKMPAQVSSGRV